MADGLPGVAAGVTAAWRQRWCGVAGGDAAAATGGGDDDDGGGGVAVRCHARTAPQRATHLLLPAAAACATASP